MFSIFRRLRTNGGAIEGNSLTRGMSAEYSDLPDLWMLDTPEMQDYGLITGGLALVLSRCSPRGIERDFLASAAAYRNLQEQFRDGKQIKLSAELLNDVRHEVQLIVDTATRNALKRCAERSIAEQRLSASNASRYWDGKRDVKREGKREGRSENIGNPATGSFSSGPLAKTRLLAQRA